VLGGQFSSRLNRKLREEKGLTYGVRTSFDFRVQAGTFSCETNVQRDATAQAVADILGEFDAVRAPGAIAERELVQAQAALTRGYVRNFETAAQIARAAAQLITFDLDDRSYDRFVPAVQALAVGNLQEAADQFVHPDDATVVAVGDEACRGPLEGLGREVVPIVPEM
jgi:predicted Zn-dependent peptidase